MVDLAVIFTERNPALYRCALESPAQVFMQNFCVRPEIPAVPIFAVPFVFLQNFISERLCPLWFLLRYTAFQKEDTIFFQTAAENVYFSPASMSYSMNSTDMLLNSILKLSFNGKLFWK